MRRVIRNAIFFILVVGISYLLFTAPESVPLAVEPLPQEIATTTALASTTPLTPRMYPVVKVVDGDTLAISKDGKNVTLRLIGVDTPETVDPRKPVQCFGKAASDKAKEILTGQSVRLEFDSSQGEFDKYGRTLAYVYLADGTLFNKFLITEGYGHEYTYRLPYKFQAEFKAAEAEARIHGKGLWAESVCAVTP